MSQAGLLLARALVRNWLMSNLEPWALKYVDGTLNGDGEDAEHLVWASSNSKRGLVTVGLYNARVPNPAFRNSLRAAWDHDHREVIAAAESRRRLISMFRYAEFPVPLPDGPVTIWRGCSSLGLKEARRGHSWTTNRDVACWFAIRFASANGRPLVLKRVVEKAQLVYFSNERDESEVIPARIEKAEICGSVDEWIGAHGRVVLARKQDASTS